ncbi:MAG: flagellar motor protein [Fibrobacterota bacterium]
MDITTVLGLIIAVGGLVMGIILEGGNLLAYVGVSAFVIIAGGTAGAVIVSHPLSHLMHVPQLILISLTNRKFDVGSIITMLGSFSDKARREGILSLEAELGKIDDEFLKLGIQLIVDGTDPALVRDILETKIQTIEKRHHHGAKIFEDAGGFAPTMGIIGTVLGLISVLSNISDAASLAASIALAFIATLYGVFSANVLWIPVANKLKAKSQQEIMVKEIMLEGILSIESGDNPRIAVQKLKAFLSQSEANKIKTNY